VCLKPLVAPPGFWLSGDSFSIGDILPYGRSRLEAGGKSDII
jgi:hypothetical protein